MKRFTGVAPGRLAAFLIMAAGSAGAAGLVPARVMNTWTLGTDARLAAESGGLVVNTGDNLYDLAGRRELLAEPLPGIQDAATLDGATYAATGEAIWRLEAEGRRTLVSPLGLEDVRLAALEGTLYVAGRLGDQAGIFAWRPGQGHRQLVTLDAAPATLAAGGDRVYFTVGGAIYCFRPGGRVVQMAVVPAMIRIEGLAVDDDRALLWASDGEAVVALDLKRLRLVMVTPRGGGGLALRGGHLFIMSHERQALLVLEQPGAALDAGTVPLRPLLDEEE